MFKKLKDWYTQNTDGNKGKTGETKVVPVAKRFGNDATMLILNFKSKNLNEESHCHIFILVS